MEYIGIQIALLNLAISLSLYRVANELHKIKLILKERKK